MRESLWESRLFKGMVIGIVLLFVAGLSCAAAVLLKLDAVVKADLSPEVLSPPVLFENPPVQLGQRLTCQMIVRTPWNKRPDRVEIKPGEGLQLASEPVILPWNYRWGWTQWAIDFELQPYRVGASPEGTVTVFFPGNQTLESAIPGVKVEPVSTGDNDELSLAAEMEKSAGTPRRSRILALIVGLILVVLVILVLRDVFRKNKTALVRVKTPWEIALDDISDLRVKLEKRQLSMEHALALLTDIVRHYLELRFGLRAERQTTIEFLAALGRSDALPDPADRKFLRSFLEAADLVKFARLPADDALFLDASRQAEMLVKATIPQEKETAVSEKGGRTP